MEIRLLRADEIECRVQQVKANGCILLLYKNARADMKILDETFGVFGWQRDHMVINDNLFCNIRIWDNENKMWITKQDVGVESNTEKEKGEASDAFKRACVNIGIGRELYSAPFTWINLDKSEVTGDAPRYKLDFKVKFEVKEIKYDDERNIIHLVVVDQTGKERFKWSKGKVTPIKADKPKEDKPLSKVDELYAFSLSIGFSRHDVENGARKYFDKTLDKMTDKEIAELRSKMEAAKKGA